MSTLAVYGGVTRLFLNGLIYTGDQARYEKLLLLRLTFSLSTEIF